MNSAAAFNVTLVSSYSPERGGACDSELKFCSDYKKFVDLDVALAPLFRENDAAYASFLQTYYDNIDAHKLVEDRIATLCVLDPATLEALCEPFYPDGAKRGQGQVSSGTYVLIVDRAHVHLCIVDPLLVPSRLVVVCLLFFA